MARKKVISAPALADWGAVDNALRDIRECQHTLAEMAVQRDRQIDSIKADYAQGALPLQNRVKALESEVKACANPVGYRQAGAYHEIQMHTKPAAVYLHTHRAAHFVPWTG